MCIHQKGECIGHRSISSLNLQKGISTVGNLKESTHRTPTYDPIYGGGNELWTEGIHKRQVIPEEEKVGALYAYLAGDHRRHMQSIQASEAECPGTSYAGVQVQRDSGMNHP